jgi:hypothetical protein
VSWHPWPYRFHLFGVAITAVSMAATVVFDVLLSKTRRGQNANVTRFIKMVAFLMIIVGSWLALGSTQWLRWFYVALPAEMMMVSGYLIWVSLKTYQGEDPRSALSRLLKKVVLVD